MMKAMKQIFKNAFQALLIGFAGCAIAGEGLDCPPPHSGQALA